MSNNNISTTLIPTFAPPHPRSFKRISEQDRIHHLIITKSASNIQTFTSFDMLTPKTQSCNNNDNEFNQNMNNNSSTKTTINNMNNNLLDGFDLFDGDIMYNTTSDVEKNEVDNISNNNNQQSNSIINHKANNQTLSYPEPTYHTRKQPINESNSPTPLFPTALNTIHTATSTTANKQSSLIVKKGNQQHQQQASLSDLMNKHTTTTTNTSTTSMLSKSTTVHRKNMLSPTSSSTSHSHKSPVKGKASRSSGGPITPPRPSFSSSDFDGLKSFSR